ncbi:MAG TPA: ABC transporter permease [Candidatus Lachnoclostridium stercorigallinarum]|uniref:ABC transporter permease n=1 Tax=Candidatus Lachnoclostridium stercorigallinarum TaxID=2838634 RepID=A0A9D2K5J3_9FIRM|nr:ABC transporter permease [Candidatus Lachnoclostridium stercorigallinarum]
MSILLGILEEGLIYAILALGVYITYSILDFPDLSVDSTFPLGSAVTAAMLVAGIPAPAALLVSFLSGVLAGTVTGLIHVKLKVVDLLSGIIVMTGLYSINLQIAGGANLAFFGSSTIFENSLTDPLWASPVGYFTVVIISLAAVVLVKVLLDAYLKTRSGYLLRAAGDNDTLVTSLAKDKGTVKIIGLALANGLVALSGSIYCQKQGFFEISTGTGSMVIGLASVIIGTKLFKRASFMKTTTAVIIGSILYKACIAAAMAVGIFPTSYMKFLTAALFLIILVISNRSKRKGAA